MSPQIYFLGIIILILFVVHQLTKKTPEFLQLEKAEMEKKVNELKKEIVKWEDDSLKDITNDMEYSFVKSMSSIVTGVIKSKDDLPVVAFQRIDRGIFINSRIIANTTDFKIYYEYKNNEKLFFFDDVYLGKISNSSDIVDSTNKKIGSFNRNNSKNQISYTLEFNLKVVAEIKKNSDRKAFVHKTYYRAKSNGGHWDTKLVLNEVQPPSPLIKSINTIDKEQLKWIISIVIFESIYHGFNFTS